MRRAWRRPSLPVLLWCCAWVLLGIVAMGGCGAAEAQDGAQTAGGAAADPLLDVVRMLLGSNPTTVLVALAGLYGLGPRIGERLGLRTGGDVPPPAAAAIEAIGKQLAKIEANQDRDYQRLSEVGDRVHDLRNDLLPLIGGIDARMTALERTPGASRR